MPDWVTNNDLWRHANDYLPEETDAREVWPRLLRHLDGGARLIERDHRGGRPRGPKGLSRTEGAQLYAEIRAAVAGRLAGLHRHDRKTWLAVTAAVGKLCAARFNGDESRARRYVRTATEPEFGSP